MFSSNENSYPLLEIQTLTSPPLSKMVWSIASAFGDRQVIEDVVARLVSASTSKYFEEFVGCSNQHLALKFGGS